MPNSSDFEATGAGVVENTAAFSGCQAAALSEDLSIHVPVIEFYDGRYMLDLKYSGGVTFTVTGVGSL